MRHCADKTILHIIKMFNFCLQLKHFPKKWKNTIIIMIPKPGKDLKNPNNQRPISLIVNTFAKVREITLVNKLKNS